jgi:hypothetical protein
MGVHYWIEWGMKVPTVENARPERIGAEVVGTEAASVDQADS